jgi:hypothetical protein
MLPSDGSIYLVCTAVHMDFACNHYNGTIMATPFSRRRKMKTAAAATICSPHQN